MRYVKKYEQFRNDLQPVNENLVVGLAVDALQFIIGAAVEYGIAAGSVGAGTPVACTAETIVDTAFATESIISAVNVVTQLKGKMDAFVDIYNKSIEAFEIFRTGKFDEFYNKIQQIIKDGLKALQDVGVDAENSLDKLAKKMKDFISKLIQKITDAVSKGIKMLIPDAALSVYASTAIKTVVEVASNNGYSIAAGAVDKLGDFKKYIIDPTVLPQLLDKTFPDLYKLLEGFKEKIEEMGYVRAIATFGGGGLTIKKMGPGGIEKLIEIIKKSEPTIKSLVDKILTIVVPAVFTLLAIIQILLKGEYKDKEEKNKVEAKKEVKS